MGEELGLREVIAMGVGGVVGGGIFAVLGVAAKMVGNAAFISYLLAAAIAAASGYSYVKMTEHLKEDGGSFTFLEHYVSNKNIAGMVGWTLILGYIGTMAMYSYAFGSFAGNMIGIEAHSIFRGFLSAGILAFFIGINLLGTGESGRSEDLLVYLKILILLGFGVIGGIAIFTRPDYSLFPGGIFNKGMSPVILGIGSIFVSFEGWQLLTYEYSEMKNGQETLKKGVLGTIAISTLIYIITAIVTISLVSPEMIIQHKETVLAFAAGKIFQTPVYSKIMATTVTFAALFSTASAINATLFGTARFSHKIATENELPEIFSFRNSEGVPSKSLIIIGVLTGLFTLIGSLKEITTFASLAFILIFGVVNYVCLKENDLNKNYLIPLFGLTGSIIAFILQIWHLYTEEFHLLIFTTGIFSVLVLTEFIYFEREEIEEETEKVEEEVEHEAQEVEEDIEKFEKDLEKKSGNEKKTFKKDLEELKLRNRLRRRIQSVKRFLSNF